MRYWDSSAIVPLVVVQGTSERAEAWLSADAEIATWTLSAVEICSAIRRLVREGALEEKLAVEAENVASELERRFHQVVDLEGVKVGAQRLLRVHALRAGDAVQLASALAWAEGHPQGFVFHTFDRALGTAAEREGFVVEGP